jgi:D-alanyl-lipoteichoic acid acyltransferase DltB (MBOAT superfamily)
VAFTSFDYLMFLGLVVALYWLLRHKSLQNALLLIASYVFYGYIHPWFCLLVAASTVLDYSAGLAMVRFSVKKKLFLGLSLLGNLGLLGFFKYFNFFAENIRQVLAGLGLEPGPLTLHVLLPAGISFYTFQSLTYTIDVYRGKVQPRRNFVDFALFVCFFPQLMAGPIERAAALLPQIERPRRWDANRFLSAWPLLAAGYLKKMVIADNVAVYVDKIFMLRQPSGLLLACGTLAFALQIYADFSGYTDIARGSARLLGFDLMENFRSPYLALSPSDFWRRWHISFSSWIRDYLYIPLGGSRVTTAWRYALVLALTFGLSGLWHGAAWNFVAWGLYHALLLFTYHQLGLAGRWQPRTWIGTFTAWFCMFSLTLVGWALFRAPSLDWLFRVLGQGFDLGLVGDSLAVGLAVLVSIAIHALPLPMLACAEQAGPKYRFVRVLAYGLTPVFILALAPDQASDFIYFQF